MPKQSINLLAKELEAKYGLPGNREELNKIIQLHRDCLYKLLNMEILLSSGSTVTEETRLEYEKLKRERRAFEEYEKKAEKQLADLL